MSDLPSDFDEAIEVMNIELNAGLEPSGCWSDYNDIHRYWQILREFSKQSKLLSFYRPEDLPDEPDVDDFSDNSC